jgi:DNA-binding response OmpR family regulator
MQTGLPAPLNYSTDPIPLRTAASLSAIHPVPSAKVNFRVLILEGDRLNDNLLIESIRAEIPDADIIHTAGVLGAMALSGLYDFNLLIIEVPLAPDAEGELLLAFAEHNPSARVIIAGARADRTATQPGEDTAVYVMHAPINPLELIEVVRACRERALGPIVPMPKSHEEEEGHFVVVLSRHSPMEVVQFKCLAGATTALDFIRRTGAGGRVWFERGEIVHAETGTLSGMDALIDMMNWPGGSIVEISVPSPSERTISMPWAMLLMQVAHAADELKASA